MSSAAHPYLHAEPESRHLWIAVAFALVAFAIGCGVSLALGELEAMYLTAAAALCVAVLFDFRIGVVSLILLLPLQDTVLFPHALMGITGLNPANLLLVATLASCLLRIGFQGAAQLLDRRLVWLYAVPIVVAAAIGAPHADEIVPYFYERELVHFTSWPGYLRDILVRPSLLAVVGLLLGAAAVHAQKPERFLIPIAISVWLMALLVIGYVVASGIHLGRLSDPSQREFFSDLGIHANSLGRVFAGAYALLLFPWWETKRPGLKLFLLATMGVLAFALLVTFSRGAFVGFLLINVLFLAWKFNFKTLGLTVLALAVVALFMPEYVIDRVTVGFDTGDPNDVSAGRVDGIWLPLLPEVWNSPVWGSGLGSVMWSLPNQIGAMLPVTHAHNAYLEALLDMGVLGLALMLAYFFHVWRRLRQLGSNPWLSPELRGFFQGAAAALVCFLVTGMAGSSLRPDSDFAYLWLAIGMMYGIAARKPAG
jgi:O-antigen ligase